MIAGLCTVLANTLVLPSDPELVEDTADVTIAAGVGEVRGGCRARGCNGDVSAVARMVGAGLLVVVALADVDVDNVCVTITPRQRILVRVSGHGQV